MKLSALTPFALALLLVPAVAHAETEQASGAQTFIDSVGVCAHLGYSDTPYGFAYPQVKKLLLDSGIRHVRDGIVRAEEQKRVLDLGRAGVQFCILAEPELGTPAEIVGKVRAINREVPRAIDAVEGPNEPDLFWVGGKKSYKGKSGANGSQEAVDAAVLFQKDVYTALKADAETKNVTSIGIALGKTYEPKDVPIAEGVLTNFVDWGNFHPYFGGNPFSVPFRYGTIEKYFWNGTHPGSNIGEYPYALRVGHPPYAPKPMSATEAGCATDTNGTSESAHGKYIPRMFCEYFQKGIKRTYSYEFVDEFTDPNNREARFGLLRRDLTPKPAYTALKNLLGILGDKNAPTTFKPGALDWTMTVSPVGEWNRTQDVHHLLLQKASGDFYLVLWHEVAVEDKSVSPRRQITVSPLPATITVNSPILGQARVYRWDEKGETTEQVVKLTNGKTLSLEIPDRVMVVKFAPARPLSRAR